jgi:site-specific DNA recombinase
LVRLLAAAKRKPCPFDAILVDDSSRLSRDTADALGILKQLEFAGIRLISVSQGIDSNSEQAHVLMTVHGMVDTLYVKELATKTRRGCEGAILRGHSAGGRCFGYDNVLTDDKHVRQQVNPAEAKVVRRIFQMRVSGHTPKSIAKTFNAEGLSSPRGKT